MSRRSLAPVLILAGVAALWAGVEFAAPALIRSAHAGRGPAALQRRLEGRDRHPAEHYVAVWLARARPAAALVTVAALLAAALTIPGARGSFFESMRQATGGDSAPEPVLPSPGRRALVAGCALVFTGGSLIELAVDPPYRGEHWPFSQYRMYSEMPRRTPLTGRRLFGVIDENPEREIALNAGRFIQPFDSARLWVAWDRFDTSPDRERQLAQAITDVLRRYELLRERGVHTGPHLRAGRLYRLTWDVDDRASNRNSPRRELLYEVQASDPPTRSR